jgi:Cu-processing system ATP-binding protein
MFDSDLLILDEPTTGLDPVALIHLKNLIQEQKEQGKTILITTHIMSFVEEMADEVVFLLDGKIYFKGTVTELKQNTKKDNLEQAIAYILTYNHKQ